VQSYFVPHTGICQDLWHERFAYCAIRNNNDEKMQAR